MPEPVRYTLDETTFRKLLWKHYGDFLLMRSRWVTGSLNVLIGCALILYRPITGLESGFFLFGVVAILMGCYLLFSRGIYIKRVVKAWKHLPDWGKQTRMSIDDAALTVETEVTKSSLSGESIAKVRDFADGFFIYLSRQHFIAVPRHAFRDNEEYLGWIDAIRALAGPDSAKEKWK